MILFITDFYNKENKKIITFPFIQNIFKNRFVELQATSV